MTACHDTSSWQQAESVGRRLGDTVVPTHLKHIVVGVDGSPNSLAALRLAGQLGARDDALVEVICVYRPHLQAQYPFSVALPPFGPAGEGTRDPYLANNAVGDAAAEARATLEDALRQVFGAEKITNFKLHAVEGGANDVLTKMAAHADLLVIGARGHSGALGLLLGSTAQACARHATCAVLIVPAAHTGVGTSVNAI
jgi:nucleotide-binding universal stress UspA family protein